MPAAPLRKNPLIRKRLVPASAAVCAMDALAAKMNTLTVCEPPRRDACEQGKSTAVGAIACSGALALVDDATPAAEQEVPLVIPPSKAVTTVRVENEVFELCELPLGAAALTGKWVLKIKRGPRGRLKVPRRDML